MKTDRELLELAAKAAGYSDLTEWKDCIRDYDSEHAGGPALHRNGAGGECWSWNALTNDGDALRLAVKLGITIGPESPDVIGKSLCRASWNNHSMSLGEYGDGDHGKATRRAIVRAAAAIGEGME